jgi:hypothetical protein
VPASWRERHEVQPGRRWRDADDLDPAGGFIILIGGIVGVWFGLNVRKQCRERAAAPPPA